MQMATRRERSTKAGLLGRKPADSFGDRTWLTAALTKAAGGNRICASRWVQSPLQIDKAFFIVGGLTKTQKHTFVVEMDRLSEDALMRLWDQWNEHLPQIKNSI
jgi:hypothetical protein